MDLKTQTKKIINDVEHFKKQFNHNKPPENVKDRDFFHFVKEETQPIFELIELWEQTALEAVKSRQVNVHPNQVTSTKENIELLLMHSYYHDVRQRRYMELYKSILYVCNQVLRDLE